MRKKIFERHTQINEISPVYLKHGIEHSRVNPSGNWHTNIEIFYALDGQGVIGCNSIEHAIKKGEIAIANSGELHYVVGNDRLEYCFVIIDSDFLLSNGIDVEKIEFESVVRSKTAAEIYESLFEITMSDEPYKQLAMRTYALMLVLELARNHTIENGMQFKRKYAYDNGIKTAITYVNSNYQEDITVDVLANIAGYSKYYFSREFKKATGMTPVTFINSVRCKNAKKLLRETNLGIHTIATMCGFVNDSYFAKTCKTLTGRTPTELRKSQ